MDNSSKIACSVSVFYLNKLYLQVFPNQSNHFIPLTRFFEINPTQTLSSNTYSSNTYSSNTHSSNTYIVPFPLLPCMIFHLFINVFFSWEKSITFGFLFMLVRETVFWVTVTVSRYILLVGSS